MRGFISALLEEQGYPAFYASAVVHIGLAEALAQALFVPHHAKLEPDRGCYRDQRGELGAQAQRKSREEDDVPEVHRVAAPRERPARHKALRRSVHPGSATAEPEPVLSNQPVLKIAPREQGQEPRLETQPPLVEHQLPGHDDDGIEQERAERRALQQPAGTPHAAACARASPAMIAVISRTSFRFSKPWMAE